MIKEKMNGGDLVKEIDVDSVMEYLGARRCYNCGGYNLECSQKISETGNTELIIACKDCKKAIKCDLLDGIKM